jgi:hypothetical protein
MGPLHLVSRNEWGGARTIKSSLLDSSFKHMDTSLLDLPIPYGNPEKAQ